MLKLLQELPQVKILYILLTVIAMFNLNMPLLLAACLMGWAEFGIVVGVILHRKLSHNIFEFKNTFAKYFCYTLLVISGSGNPMGWVIIHRLHHKLTDQVGDPQSPHTVGRLRSFFSWYKTPLDTTIASDLKNDKALMFICNYSKSMFFVYVMLLFAIDPMYALYFGGVAPFICLILLGFINTFAHDDYSREQGTLAKDLPGLLLFSGENLHKAHHLSPQTARFHKYDLSYFFIKLIGKLK